MSLTDRQRWVLRCLQDSQFKWNRPMDIGGYDGSWHSAVLNQLVKKGLVEMRKRGTLIAALGSYRAGRVYRLVKE